MVIKERGLSPVAVLNLGKDVVIVSHRACKQIGYVLQCDIAHLRFDARPAYPKMMMQRRQAAMMACQKPR